MFKTLQLNAPSVKNICLFEIYLYTIIYMKKINITALSLIVCSLLTIPSILASNKAAAVNNTAKPARSLTFKAYVTQITTKRYHNNSGWHAMVTAKVSLDSNYRGSWFLSSAKFRCCSNGYRIITKMSKGRCNRNNSICYFTAYFSRGAASSKKTLYIREAYFTVTAITQLSTSQRAAATRMITKYNLALIKGKTWTQKT